MPVELSSVLLERRNSVPRPLSAPACLNHLSQECPEFAHLYRVHHHGYPARQDGKSATIRQHYYPEGGWGWTVCACGVLVQLLSDGLMASHGFVAILVQRKFKEAATSSSSLAATSSPMKLSESPRLLDPLVDSVTGDPRIFLGHLSPF